MNNSVYQKLWLKRLSIKTMLLALACLVSFQTHALTLTVQGSDGIAVTNYRWLIEEDATHNIVPGKPARVVILQNVSRWIFIVVTCR